VQPHGPHGQGAGFVGAQHVHTAEIFNRGQAFDDHLLLRHSLSAVGEIDADDGRQQLRRQADGQRHGKQKGLKDRALQVHIDGKNREHQQQRDFQQ